MTEDNLKLNFVSWYVFIEMCWNSSATICGAVKEASHTNSDCSDYAAYLNSEFGWASGMDNSYYGYSR